MPNGLVLAIGNIALAATTLELALARLAVAVNIAAVPTSDRADLMRRWGPEYGTRIVAELRRQLDRLPDRYRSDFSDYLDSTEAALGERHQVVHAFWVPFSRKPPKQWLWGKFNRPLKDKTAPDERSAAGITELPDLHALIDRLLDARHWAGIWQGRLESG